MKINLLKIFRDLVQSMVTDNIGERENRIYDIILPTSDIAPTSDINLEVSTIIDLVEETSKKTYETLNQIEDISNQAEQTEDFSYNIAIFEGFFESAINQIGLVSETTSAPELFSIVSNIFEKLSSIPLNHFSNENLAQLEEAVKNEEIFRGYSSDYFDFGIDELLQHLESLKTMGSEEVDEKEEIKEVKEIVEEIDEKEEVKEIVEEVDEKEESKEGIELIGDAGRNILRGGDYNDKLYGEGGRDRLYGGKGDDELYGGTGMDFLRGGDGNDKLYGGADRDKLYGDDGDDKLYGEGGRDRLYGGKGDDELYGGTGMDFLRGGDGNDKLYCKVTWWICNDSMAIFKIEL